MSQKLNLDLNAAIGLPQYDTPFLRADWPAPAQVKTLLTTRKGGVSRAPFAGLNVGAHVGDAPADVATVAAIVKTILWDERRVMPVSTLIDGQYSYDEHDVFLSLPVALDGDGVGDFVDLHLTDDEMARFHDSARIVREHCAMIADRL